MPFSEQKIRCPKCEWEPDAGSLWSCTCNHIWNTFDTYGQCPACKKIWKDTCCLSCFKWSKHVDWYVDLPEVPAAVEEEIFISVPKQLISGSKIANGNCADHAGLCCCRNRR